MSQPLQLAYDALGNGPALVVLHGFLGAGENWRTVLKPYQERFTVYYLDQRNHGRSPHAAPHDYPTLAEDLHAFMDQQGLETAILLGHSMGGKVAALFALMYPKRVKSLVVVDMALSRNDHRHFDILSAMQGLEKVRVSNRAEAKNFLEGNGIDPETTQFLLKSFERTPDGTYRWRLNLEVLIAEYSAILEPIDNLPAMFDGPAAFIRGADSDYLSNESFAEAQRLFPFAKLYTVSNAGHWVHAANPTGFQSALNSFLATLA